MSAFLPFRPAGEIRNAMPLGGRAGSGFPATLERRLARSFPGTYPAYGSFICSAIPNPRQPQQKPAGVRRPRVLNFTLLVIPLHTATLVLFIPDAG